MSSPSFSSVAHHVVGQYSQVGKLIVGAYRNGAKRLLTGANTRYVSFLDSRDLPLVNDAVKASLIKVQTRIADAFVSGIAAGTDRADQAIELLAGGVNGGIQRVATTVDRVEAAFDTRAITTVGQLTMPVAQVSLAIATRAVEGTKRLSARVNGAEGEAEGEAEAVVAAVKPAVKKAARRTAAVSANAKRKVVAKTRARA